MTSFPLDIAFLTLLAGYLLFSAYSQSDAELVHPETALSLKELAGQQSGLETGQLLAPFLNFKIPLIPFYGVAPALILIAHGYVLLRWMSVVEHVRRESMKNPSFEKHALRALDHDMSAEKRLRRTALRNIDHGSKTLFVIAAIVPTALLCMMRWKFAPYASARPYGSVVGEFITAVHQFSIIADGWIISYAASYIFDKNADEFYVILKAAFVLSMGAAALNALLVLPGPTWHFIALPVEYLPFIVFIFAVIKLTLNLLTQSYSDEDEAIAWIMICSSSILVILYMADLILGFALNSSSLTFVILSYIRLVALILMFSLLGWIALANALSFGEEAYPMERQVMERMNTSPASRSALLVLLLIAGVGTPERVRALDLTDARLVGAAPSDDIVAALINRDSAELESRDRNSALKSSHDDAWMNFGEGLNYSEWRFPSVSFVGSTLGLIDFTEADLTAADLSRANLVGARLHGAWLGGAKLGDANLRRTDMSYIRPRGANRHFVAAPQGPGETVAAISAASKCGYDTKDPPDVNERLYLVGADLSGADLTCADLRMADMSKVIMDNSTTLDSTNLIGALLTSSILRGVNFSTALIDRTTDFSCSDLEGATMPLNMEGVLFDYAHTRGMKIGDHGQKYVGNPGGRSKLNGLQFAYTTQRKDGFKCNQVGLDSWRAEKKAKENKSTRD